MQLYGHGSSSSENCASGAWGVISAMVLSPERRNFRISFFCSMLVDARRPIYLKDAGMYSLAPARVPAELGCNRETREIDGIQGGSD